MITIGINASFLRKQHTGIGQVTFNFLERLKELSISHPPFPHSEEVRFIVYLEEDMQLDLPENFSPKILLPKYRRDDLIRKMWWEKVMLPKAAKKDGCDLLLSLYQSATIVSSIPHIMIVHDLIPKLFPVYLGNSRKRLYQNLIEKAIRKADRIIAVSKHTEKDIIRLLNVGPEKISVVYNDVDPIYKQAVSAQELEEVMGKYGLSQGYIYSGGGFEVRKNMEQLLLAYQQLLSRSGSRSVPPLVISGKLIPELAPLAFDIQTRTRELGLEDNVKLLGFVPQEDMPALYRGAAVFVYPSLYEGFGLPVLEAMNQGTPVITSKRTSLPEVGSDAVLYCDPYDYRDVAMVIGNVLGNDHLQAALSLKGQERSRMFSWDSFVQKTLNIIFSMLSAKQ